ncbi:unnamed protein product [Didymodactylos carnosus]|uniref:Glycosyltransferase n=1 Tax=Didymodactylos carnosus TaxID=1234261 RepID=A0A814RE29_9BILA|nr:unnamed protein product [Didymodactylos carnosus]CAF1132223.1 unnamed protein product [Didymodactylos carnosus]CAF3511944.1 unnamed protein product [Didymodactylos carnosus]CAF3896000.1 unnamed protein product [Didymodactylos carnosus]
MLQFNRRLTLIVTSSILFCVLFFYRTLTFSSIPDVDFHHMIYLLKLYQKYSLENNHQQQQQQLEIKLFPWFRNSLYEIQNLTHINSKGIVICTGNKHFNRTQIALEGLLSIQNQLPIEIMYSSDEDLDHDLQRLLLEQFPLIKLIDLSTIFNDNLLQLRGWEIKPFAILASSFHHIILMDSDVFFLQLPAKLFQNPLYIQNGALFFYDRVNLNSNELKWVKSLLIDHSITVNNRTQESGVVVMDKIRSLYGLLLTCKLNEKYLREKYTYRYLYGDKDTYWLSFKLINQTYAFLPTYTGTIGKISHNNRICGHILHLDLNWKPLWWNGAFYKNPYRLLNIQGWLEEGIWNRACITNNKHRYREFNGYQHRLIDSYKNITKKFFKPPSWFSWKKWAGFILQSF